jgi:MobA/MobL family
LPSKAKQGRTYTLPLRVNVCGQGFTLTTSPANNTSGFPVAIFHLAAQIIGRAAGRSATAAAAYRLATVIDDDRTGMRFDFTRKTGVAGWQIVGPETMPEHFRDPAVLWNAVEAVEKRQDAQLCREINVALPRELSPEQNRALVLNWCQHFTDAGMIVCAAFHHLDGENPHAHLMLTLREISGDGFGNKVRAWNDRRVLDQWRETWAETVNRHLSAAGLETRVDHRTLEAQGIEREPTQHLGPIAHAMTERGAMSDRTRIAVPTPPTMDHAHAVQDMARERHEPTPQPMPTHVRETMEAVAHARQAHQVALLAEAQKRQAAQRAAVERSAAQQVARADRQVQQAAAQRAEALHREAQAHKAQIEQWKRRHQWRMWLWRHGVRAAIPDAVRRADKARAQAKRLAAEAEHHRQNAAELAAASLDQLHRIHNAHAHCQRLLSDAERHVAETAERVRQTEGRWAGAWVPARAQRQAERPRETSPPTDALPRRRSLFR